MALSSSYVIDSVPQADGTFYVTETHTDSEGVQHVVGPYTVTSEAQVATLMAARADHLERLLADAEALRATWSDETIGPAHQTGAAMAERIWGLVRDAYADGNKLEFCRLVHWIAGKVAAGEITDAAARSTFNAAFDRALDATEWATLKTTRLIPARDRYQAMLDEAEL